MKPKATRGKLLGILNKSGEFWSYNTFNTEAEAHAYIAAFWRGNPKIDLRQFTVVPVRVTVSLDRTEDPAP